MKMTKESLRRGGDIQEQLGDVDENISKVQSRTFIQTMRGGLPPELKEIDNKIRKYADTLLQNHKKALEKEFKSL